MKLEMEMEGLEGEGAYHVKFQSLIQRDSLVDKNKVGGETVPFFRGNSQPTT